MSSLHTSISLHSTAPTPPSDFCKQFGWYVISITMSPFHPVSCLFVCLSGCVFVLWILHLNSMIFSTTYVPLELLFLLPLWGRCGLWYFFICNCLYILKDSKCCWKAVVCRFFPVWSWGMGERAAVCEDSSIAENPLPQLALTANV